MSYEFETVYENKARIKGLKSGIIPILILNLVTFGCCFISYLMIPQLPNNPELVGATLGFAVNLQLSNLILYITIRKEIPLPIRMFKGVIWKQRDLPVPKKEIYVRIFWEGILALLTPLQSGIYFSFYLIRGFFRAVARWTKDVILAIRKKDESKIYTWIRRRIWENNHPYRDKIIAQKRELKIAIKKMKEGILNSEDVDRSEKALQQYRNQFPYKSRAEEQHEQATIFQMEFRDRLTQSETEVSSIQEVDSILDDDHLERQIEEVVAEMEA